jgi:hypothetical protein
LESWEGRRNGQDEAIQRKGGAPGGCGLFDEASEIYNLAVRGNSGHVSPAPLHPFASAFAWKHKPMSNSGTCAGGNVFRHLFKEAQRGFRNKNGWHGCMIWYGGWHPLSLSLENDSETVVLSGN